MIIDQRMMAAARDLLALRRDGKIGPIWNAFRGFRFSIDARFYSFEDAAFYSLQQAEALIRELQGLGVARKRQTWRARRRVYLASKGSARRAQ